MGHYHRIINLTQRQVLVPMEAGALDKIMEFGMQSASAMGALWLMLGREAWAGDRIAILGYEGRAGDLDPDVVEATGIDGTAYYDTSFDCAGQLARDLLIERGVCTFDRWFGPSGTEHWRVRWPERIVPAGLEVVAVNLDRDEMLDPAALGDSRDLVVAAATGGDGGITTALAIVLAASNRGGSRGGGDLRSRHPVVGSWAGDRVAVVPLALAADRVDVTAQVRAALIEAGEARYEIVSGVVTRPVPPWKADLLAGAAPS